MDADLAFCLERFADDQMAENIERIRQLECQLETKRNEFAGTLKLDDDVAYRLENTLVEQFSRDLKENDMKYASTSKIIETEFRKALDRTVTDIDTIAQTVATMTKNQKVDEALRTASNKIRHQIGQIDSELAHLNKTINSNKSSTYSSCIMTWAKQHYGYVAELSQMISKDSSFIDQLAFSEKSPLVQQLLERTDHLDHRRRFISDFIKQFGEDEATNKYIFDSLSHMKDTESALEFVRSYIQCRQVERRQQQEELLQRMELEFEQQRADQQTRALEMASAIYQLSVGSANASQFDNRLKQILEQSRASKQFVPVLIGHIEEASVKDLPFILHLEADYDKWITNTHSIQQQFCSTLCKTMQLPPDAISIERIEQGSVIFHLVIHPPHGQLVFEQISRHGKNDPSSTLNLEAIQKCCQKFDSRIHSIVLGTYELTIEKRLMDFKWNKKYFDRYQAGGTYWSGSMSRGGKPYFCPEGWNRFGVKVAESKTAFDAKWGSWHVAYHGTEGSNAPLILASGLKLSCSGCYVLKGHQSVYLSPSIEYSAHPRYAHPWKKIADGDGGKHRYYQLVFQCRVNPNVIGIPKPETLLYAADKAVRIDKNFRNDELEWVITAENITQEYIRNNIICYGLMVRVIDGEPKDLPVSRWWQHSHHAVY